MTEIDGALGWIEFFNKPHSECISHDMPGSEWLDVAAVSGPRALWTGYQCHEFSDDQSLFAVVKQVRSLLQHCAD